MGRTVFKKRSTPFFTRRYQYTYPIFISIELVYKEFYCNMVRQNETLGLVLPIGRFPDRWPVASYHMTTTKNVGIVYPFPFWASYHT